jgi:hypothetical protein
MADAPRKRRIILVHGTWGRGVFPSSTETVPTEIVPDDEVLEADDAARWYEPTSWFRISLSYHLRDYGVSAQIEAFLWSGANSVYERDAAAHKLKDRILASEDDTTIIAHSHGGNVAMRAIHLLNDNRQIKLITLATPFLSTFATEPIQFPETLTHAVLFFALLLLLGPSGFIGGVVAGLLALILINVLLYGIINTGGVHTLWPLGQSWLGRPWRLVQASKSTNAIGKTSLLVIRGIEDEAGLILAAATMGNRLSSVVLAALATRYGWASFALMGLGSFIAKAIGFIATAKVLYLILTISAVCLFVLPIIAGLFKSVFGRELAVGSSRVIVQADGVPDHVDATVVTLTASVVHPLRHSVYETDLASWVTPPWILHKKIPDDLVELIERRKDMLLETKNRTLKDLLRDSMLKDLIRDSMTSTEGIEQQQPSFFFIKGLIFLAAGLLLSFLTGLYGLYH